MEITFPTEEEIQEAMRKRRIAKSGLKDKPTPEATPEPTEEEDNTPAAHYLTPKIHAIIAQRENLYLVGPAGSGKSYVVEETAAQLKLPFYCPPIGRETTNAQLFGYFNASGQYVRTPIREAVEFGGVLHLEEIDFASPAVGTALNALLANRTIGFPDSAIPRHPELVIVASANTFGTGANAQYIGSQGLNAATLDRFIFLEVPYDERMEHKIAPDKNWCRHVQAIRARVSQLGLKHVVSPRATIKGGHLIATGAFTWEEIENMVLFKGLDAITVAKLKGSL